MTLFDLTNEYKAILSLAEEEGTDPEIIATHLEDIDVAIEDKADSIAYILTQLGGDVAVLKEEEARLAKRRRGIQANADRIKKLLEDTMRETGKTKIKTPFHTFFFSKSRETVKVLDATMLPARFLIPQEPKVDTEALLAEMKKGVTFDCAVIEQKEGLRIR